MVVSLPTSADIRKVRSQANKAVNAQVELVRTPLLAWLGAGDLAYNAVNDALTRARSRAAQRREAVQERFSDLPTELRERLTTEELRRRVDDAGDQARQRYSDLAGRGEETLERIRTQPNVARALRNVEDAQGRFDKRIEKAVDDAHDAGEEALGRVTFETRSVGERAARATQRFAGETAESVSRFGKDAAEAVEDAGDEAAHTTRSASRKAANRTAPRKPATTARRSAGATGKTAK